MAERKVSPARVANAMRERDKAAELLGIRILSVRAHYARLTMTVREDMLNGHGICHGGIIFTFADTAFAYACNTGNIATVAAGADITFVAPGKKGDVLTAVCELRHRGGRSGVYDTIVKTRQQTIALFRGRSRQLQGSIVATGG